MSETTRWEKLNAYIDGELDDDAAEQIGALVAGDPAAAHDLAALRRVKVTLADSVEAPDFNVPEASKPVSQTGRVRWASAAVLALVVSAAVLLRIVTPGAGLPTDTRWLAIAHNEWVLGSASEDPVPLPRKITSRRPGFDEVYIPELSSGRLYLAHVGQTGKPGHGHALIAGYRGTRGCTVTLAVTRRIDGLTEKLEPVIADSMKGFAWRIGNIGFYVVAHGMAKARLQSIAEGIRETNLRRLPLRSETRVALAKGRAENPPCRA